MQCQCKNVEQNIYDIETEEVNAKTDWKLQQIDKQNGSQIAADSQCKTHTVNHIKRTLTTNDWWG